MRQGALRRWAPLSGPVFVVLMIAGFIIAGSSPDSDASDAKIAAYLAKSSNQSHNEIAWIILLVAMLFLVAFFATLRSRLVEAEGGIGRFGAMALGAGIASSVFLITGDQHLRLAVARGRRRGQAGPSIRASIASPRTSATCSGCPRSSSERWRYGRPPPPSSRPACYRAGSAGSASSSAHLPAASSSSRSSSTGCGSWSRDPAVPAPSVGSVPAAGSPPAL